MTRIKCLVPLYWGLKRGVTRENYGRFARVEITCSKLVFLTQYLRILLLLSFFGHLS